MLRVKYKHLKLLIVATALVLTAFTTLPVFLTNSTVSADPHPTCNGTSTFDPSTNNCTCQSGVLIVGTTGDSCSDSCPSGMVSSTVNGQPVCNAPVSSGGSSCSGDQNEAYCTGGETTGGYQCGSGNNAIRTTVDFGCKGASCQGNCSAVLDLTFAIIRFLSYGVGLVVVASIIIAGIQYTTSRGDPQATAEATKRISNTVVALIVYIFAYAILNYVIPAGLFKT